MCICSPDSSGRPAVEFVATVFDQCVYSKTQLVSFIIGWGSTLGWLFAHAPQIRVNFILKTTEGVSLFFNILWIIADSLTFISSVITKQLLTSNILLGYAAFMDLVLLFQYILFGRKNAKFEERHISKVTAVKVTTDENLQGHTGNDESSSTTSSTVECRGCDQSCSAKDAETSSVSVPDTDLHRVSTLERTKQLIEQRGSSLYGGGGIVGNEALQEIMRQRTLNLKRARRLAQVQMQMVLDGMNHGEVVPYEELPTLDDINDVKIKKSTEMSKNSKIFMGICAVLIILFVVFLLLWLSEYRQTRQSECTETETPYGLWLFGYIVAWVCGIVYIAAAIVGCLHILRSKQAEDKSPMFFYAAFIGNVCYCSSMLFSDLSGRNLINTMPFLSTSLVTTVLYCTNGSLIVYYGKNPGGRKAKHAQEDEANIRDEIDKIGLNTSGVGAGVDATSTSTDSASMSSGDSEKMLDTPKFDEKYSDTPPIDDMGDAPNMSSGSNQSGRRRSDGTD